MKSLLSLLVLLGCAHRPQAPRIESWGIQLQGYENNDSLKKIRTSTKDLWVIDPDPFTSSMVKSLRGKGKKLIAYLSIGEAEGYRSYFKKLPKELVLEENPEWEENYTVRFWESGWERVVLESLGRIQEKGFDGVFLDVVDVFERFPDETEKARAMAELIAKIATTGRKRDPDFFVIMQNGLRIRRLIDDEKSLLKAIDAVNVEDLYEERGSLELQEDIRYYKSAGKLVLGLEYLRDPQAIQTYEDFAREHGILLLLSGKALDGTESAY